MYNQTVSNTNVLHHQFYGRQFINEEVVYLNGEYYYYTFENVQPIDNQKQYEVIDNNGSQLIIKAI